MARRQLVPAEVELVRLRVARDIRRGGRQADQRKRERLDHAPGDVVLKPEQVAEGRLHGQGGQQRPGWRLDELHRRAHLLTRAEQRSRDHPIHVGLRGNGLEVGRLAGKSRRDGARANDQRAGAGQGRGNRIGQAERQEVRLRIGTQRAERQHHETREHLGHGRHISRVTDADAAQLAGHLVGRLRPVPGPLGERPANHAIDRRHGRRAGEGRGLLVHGGAKNLWDGAASERGAAREDLEKDGAHGERITTGVGRLAEHAFRRNVTRSADQDAGAREIRRGGERLFRLGPCDPEVEHLHAVRRQKHVGRLEVAVDDAASVHGRERGEDVEGDRHGLRDAHGPLLKALVERLAFQQLHRDERIIAVVISDVINLADVRMIDARRRARLAPEALARGLVVGL